jgi:hypothetical protein
MEGVEMPNEYTADERKMHVLGWADQNQGSRSMRVGEYARKKNIKATTMKNWVTGRKGVKLTDFTPEEQTRITIARKRFAYQVHTFEERKNHVLGWADQNQKSHSKSVEEYARENNIPPTTMREWVIERKGVKLTDFASEEQARIQRASAFAAPSQDVNSAVALAAGGRRYSWMAGGGKSTAVNPSVADSESSSHRGREVIPQSSHVAAAAAMRGSGGSGTYREKRDRVVLPRRSASPERPLAR